MKICCFGSLNLDMVFSVREFVQPKETIQSKGFTVFAGGKGLNQALAIQKAGVDVLMAGSVGHDGQMLLDVCDQSGMDRRFVRVTDTSTGLAMIQVNEAGENCIILYDGANKVNDEAFIGEVLNELTSGDLLVLQNEVNNLDFLIKTASARGIRIVLNPSPYEDSLKELPLELCSYLVLNEVEGKAISGADEPEKILTNLAGIYPNTAVILTQGSQGVSYSADGKIGHQNAFRVKAVDSTGAGDTFTGYFIAMTAKGMDLKDAIHIAQKAGAISVTRQGAAGSIPTIEEVDLADF